MITLDHKRNSIKLIIIGLIIGGAAFRIETISDHRSEMVVAVILYVIGFGIGGLGLLIVGVTTFSRTQGDQHRYYRKKAETIVKKTEEVFKKTEETIEKAKEKTQEVVKKTTKEIKQAEKTSND